MIKDEIEIRVRYGETDQMGVVYHGVYPAYLEQARTEMIRKAGLTYKEMELSGCMMPVVSLSINYKRPALYDELLRIVTYVKKLPSSRIVFDYEIFNAENTLLSTATTTLVFMDTNTKRPMRPPKIMMDKMEKYFN